MITYFKKMMLCAFSVIIIASTGCSVVGGENEDIPLMKVEGSYEVFESLEELTNSASDIVEVQVTKDQQTIVVEDMPVTISSVKIKNVIQGSLTKNQEIYIQEIGGIFQPYLEGDISKGKQTKKVEMAFEGVRVMKPGDRHVLFINKMNKEDALVDGAYYVLGLFQGRYKFMDNKFVKEGPNFNPEQFTEETIDELKLKIKRAKNK